MPSRQGEFENSHAEIQSLNNDNILGCSISNTYLKYLVLGNMLKNLGLNPFDLPEVKLYKNDQEILIMMNLVISLYQNSDITNFEKILKTNHITTTLWIISS